MSIEQLRNNDTEFNEYVNWLKERSILLKNKTYVDLFSGSKRQWKCSFGKSTFTDVLKNNSVWLATYPDAVICAEDKTVLQTLGDPRLYSLLSSIGINGIHTGPMKVSGSINNKKYGASIDGHFDRIDSRIDPDYGTHEEYLEFAKTAGEHGIIAIGDLIPGHTGKGADFRLAELNEPGFSGIYSMLSIDAKHWSFLPDVALGDDSANLTIAQAVKLNELGYSIVSPLDVEVFSRPGIKETSWSATLPLTGVDGIVRRWVYLHIFKDGQPSLNWMDPSAGAQRLITADMLHTLHDLGVKGLRLDATMFLGVEPRATGQKGWLGGHPLSTHVTDYLGMMIRKFGGFSFQELNIDLANIRKSLNSGPEFNYDFPTRPGYLYALTIEDAGPLRLLLREMLKFDVQPSRFVHGMQNHDELMLEATHLTVNGEKNSAMKEWKFQGRHYLKKLAQRSLPKQRAKMRPITCHLP